MPSLQTFVNRMDYWCRIANLGYCWTHRWDIRDGGESDCSSLTIHCLKEAGFDTGSAYNTSTLSAALTARGWRRLPANIADARPGDILLNDANHVAVVISGTGWNATIAQASQNEYGGVYGGQPGDQTGQETNERRIYNYPWDCILRYAQPVSVPKRKKAEVKPVSNLGGKVYRLGKKSTGQHLLTTSTAERDSRLKDGWKTEDNSFTMPKGGVNAVYRLYNPNNGDHMYTINVKEAEDAEKAGWDYEGVPFFAPESGVPVYRAYNKKSGQHHWTTSKSEYDSITKGDWSPEGIAFYAEKAA